MCGTVQSLREDEHVNCNSNYNRSDLRIHCRVCGNTWMGVEQVQEGA